MKYNIGICEWALPVNGPLAIKCASKIGYDGIQLGEAGGRKKGFPLNHKFVQDSYLKAARKNHIKLHSINLGDLLSEGLINYSPRTLNGEYARECLKNGIFACHSLDVSTLVITINSPNEDALKNTISHLNYAIEIARYFHVELALECALPWEHFAHLLDSVSPDFKVCMDMLNPLRFQTGDPIRQLHLLGKDKISHFHMKDSISGLFSSKERGCVLLGQGDAHYPQAVDTIKEIRFSGWIFSENYYYLPPMNMQQDFMNLSKTDCHTLKNSFCCE